MKLKEARAKFLNKAVSIPDHSKKSVRGHCITGKLNFLGTNDHFSSWEMCATVGRFPMQHVNLDDITLLDVTHRKHLDNHDES